MLEKNLQSGSLTFFCVVFPWRGRELRCVGTWANSAGLPMSCLVIQHKQALETDQTWSNNDFNFLDTSKRTEDY